VHAQAGAHLIKGLNNSRGLDIKHIGEDSPGSGSGLLVVVFFKGVSQLSDGILSAGELLYCWTI